MAQQQIRFEDGAAYERLMGTWSRLVGDIFLNWLNPATGLRWIDVGCGNGAFTQLIVDRCAPAEVQGIDPSEAQLAFGRARSAGRMAEFRQGDAMRLPFADDSFDAAVMALVIFFVPDPTKCVAEMVRVTRPGGTVASYAWDMLGGGFPLEPIHAELRTIGIEPALAPNPGASRMEALEALWTGAGLGEVGICEIKVQRTFADFDDFWKNTLASPSLTSTVAAMAPKDVESLKARVSARLPADAAGRISYEARANAISGRVPN